ncbi:MAG: Major outer membrane porin [Chlamydiae bacterium]|nr:Major outer membrane porin [Chlamydiota bacterium]
MKRLIALGLTLLTCGAAYALPLGNPSEASLMCDGLFCEGRCADFCDPCVDWCDALSFRMGFYGDYVFNRHMEIDNNHNKGNDIEHFEIYTNAGYLAFNAWDRIDIFATLGASNIRLETNSVSLAGYGSGAIAGDRFVLETETHFSWSVGARGTLYECGCCSFGIEGQYFYTKPDITRMTSRAIDSVYPDNLDMKYHEWQVGIGISYRIWNLVPYFGAKWSGAHAEMGDAVVVVSSVTPVFNTLLSDLENRFNGGYVLGVSLVDCEKASLTVEARFPDEKAVYVNGQFRF